MLVSFKISDVSSKQTNAHLLLISQFLRNISINKASAFTLVTGCFGPPPPHTRLFMLVFWLSEHCFNASLFHVRFLMYFLLQQFLVLECLRPAVIFFVSFLQKECWSFAFVVSNLTCHIYESAVDDSELQPQFNTEYFRKVALDDAARESRVNCLKLPASAFIATILNA